MTTTPIQIGCAECGAPLIYSRTAEIPEGHKRHHAHDKCRTCYRRASRRTVGVKPRPAKPVACSRCDVTFAPRGVGPKSDQHGGHGLCSRCYNRAYYGPRRYIPATERAEEYEHFKSFGMTDRTIAARMGIKLDSLRQALRRAARSPQS